MKQNLNLKALETGIEALGYSKSTGAVSANTYYKNLPGNALAQITITDSRAHLRITRGAFRLANGTYGIYSGFTTETALESIKTKTEAHG